MAEIIIPIVIAVIGVIGTIGSAIISARTATKTTLKIVDLRLEQLEKKVEKHNNVLERTQAVELNQAVITERIDLMREEIKELKGA